MRVFLLAFFVLGSIPLASQGLDGSDGIIIVPNRHTKSAIKLSYYLTKGDTTDFQRALHIYNWIIHNISYDVKSSKSLKMKRISPESTLRRKKGICYQYSELFNVLCHNAGLISVEINGYSRGAVFYEGDILYEADHSWNAVKLDSVWYLLDPTWGAGGLIKKRKWLAELRFKWFKRPFINDKVQFIQHPNDTYWLVAPEEFLQDHLPLDPVWQFVEYPISVETFESNKWTVYQDSLDSVYSKKLEPEMYHSTLAGYEYLSPLQYLNKTAIASHLFNPRNFEWLAVSSFNNGISHIRSVYSNDTIVQRAKRELRQAVSLFHNHSQSVYRCTNLTVRNYRQRLNAEVRAINHQRIQANTSQSSTTSKLLNRINSLTLSWSRKVESGSGLRQNGADLKSVDFLRNRPTVVERNLSLVLSNFPELLQLRDSAAGLYPLLDSLIENKRYLQQLVMANSNSLDHHCKTFTPILIERPDLTPLATKSVMIDSIGHVFDSLFEQERTNQANIRAQYRDFVGVFSLLKSKSALIQKWMVQTYQFGEVRDTSLLITYKESFSILDEVGRLVEQMNRKIYFSLEKDREYLVGMNEQLIQMRNELELHQKLILLTEELRLGGIYFKQERSNKMSSHFINRSNQQLRKINRYQKMNH